MSSPEPNGKHKGKGTAPETIRYVNHNPERCTSSPRLSKAVVRSLETRSEEMGPRERLLVCLDDAASREREKSNLVRPCFTEAVRYFHSRARRHKDVHPSPWTRGQKQHALLYA